MSVSPSNTVKALGIDGSLRPGSCNRALLRAARDLAPDDLEIAIFDNEALKGIPPCNGDVQARGDPEPLKALKDAIREADALVIATPEYNHTTGRSEGRWTQRQPTSAWN